MTTESSCNIVLLKKLPVILLLIGAIFRFAERVEAQEKIEVEEIVEKNNSESAKKTMQQREEVTSYNLTNKKQLTKVEDIRLQSLKKATQRPMEKNNTGFDYLNDVNHYCAIVNQKTNYYIKDGNQIMKAFQLVLRKQIQIILFLETLSLKDTPIEVCFVNFLIMGQKKIQKKCTDSPIQPIKVSSKNN